MNRTFKDNLRDSFITSAGWLFADLLLALTMVFMAANTVTLFPPTILPPKLVVNPTNLNPKDSHCTSSNNNLSCTVTLQETADSQGTVNWQASSDMSDTKKKVMFSPGQGILSPGKSVTIAISNIPCQNGSFTFSGKGVNSVTTLWNCTPNDRILEHFYCRIKLDIGNPSVFTSEDVNSSRNTVEPQLNRQQFLKDRQVGIAIGYGGTIGGSEQQGTDVATRVYLVLVLLAQDSRAQMYPVFRTSSLYEPLFTGYETSNTAIINVYLVVQSDNPGETCNPKTNQPISK